MGNEKERYQNNPDLYGRRITPVLKPEKEIGIDSKDNFYDNLLQAGLESKVDMTTINSFSGAAQNRETLLELIDTMGQDPTIGAVLETYAEDATETNDKGKVVWCESAEENISSMVSYLLEAMNVDKYAYDWMYHLCKYGDLYLRLYRKSQYEDTLFDNEEKPEDRKLNEDLILNVAGKNDNYVHYIEMVPNPAEMFELTKFGKTYAYIQADVRKNQAVDDIEMVTQSNFNRYKFRKHDVNIYQPTEFVHAYLNENTTRQPETVDIFLSDDIGDVSTQNKLSYKVRRGQSLLYNSFKIWREMMLLQNAILLNRLTKSSMVRAIEVEVGDMPQEKVGPHLMNIKNLMEQKSSLSVGNSLAEYTNPGAIENNIYIPTHDGKGSISIQQVGGDADVRGLTDLDYFNNLLFGSLRIPKQYLGFTDDNAGFSGGQSLSLISSRYAKMIKRLQNALCQALTDVVNLMLLDKNLDSYVNRFTIRMQEPTTQEVLDRRAATSSKLSMVSDIMNLVGDIEDPATKLNILKILLGNTIDEPEILTLIQEVIDQIEEGDGAMGMDEIGDSGDYTVSGGGGLDGMDSFDLGGSTDEFDLGGSTDEFDIESESPRESEVGGELPTPEETGAGDFTDNSAEF